MDALPTASLSGAPPPAAPSSSPQVSQALVPQYDPTGHWIGYARAPDTPGGASAPDQVPKVIAPTSSPIEVSGAKIAPKGDDTWMDALPTAALPGKADTTAASQEDQTGFGTKLVQSTAAALHAIPRGIVGGKTVDYINAATEAPLRMLYGDVPQPQAEPEGGVPTPQVQGLYGPTPQQGFRLASPAQAFSESLRHSAQEDQALSTAAPIADVGGQLLGGAAGGAMAAPALARAALPVGAGLLAKAGNAGSYIARNAAFGGGMSALSGGDPTTGAIIGGAIPAAQVALGPVLKPIGNTVSTIGSKIAQAAGSEGAQGKAVGRALSDVVGGSPIQSDIGPLDLAQATNNPNVAAKVDVANQFNNDAVSTLRDQQASAVRQQVANLGKPMSAADSSAESIGAIRDLRSLAGKRETELWNHPALTDYPFATGGIKQTSQQALNDIQKSEPGLVQLGMRGDVKDAFNGILSLPDNANLSNINSYISPLKTLSRRPPPDNPQAGILASRLLDRIAPSVDATVTSSGAPSATMDAYNAAKSFTRTRAGIFGTPDMKQILAKDNGIYKADPSEAMRKFFNFANGSPEGPANLQELSDFADQIKQAWVGRGAIFQKLSDTRDALRDNGRAYVAQALTNAARLNEGQNFAPGKVQDFLRINRPWMESSGMFTPKQLDTADTLMGYADKLQRNPQLMKQVNSATSGREEQKKTFIDGIMSSWMKHITSGVLGVGVGTTVGHFVGPEMGGMAGTGVIGGVENRVATAEASMRKMMAAALADPEMAKDLMMKGNEKNMLFMSQRGRDMIDTARAAVGSDILPQFIGARASSPATVPMSQ